MSELFTHKSEPQDRYIKGHGSVHLVWDNGSTETWGWINVISFFMYKQFFSLVYISLVEPSWSRELKFLFRSADQSGLQATANNFNPVKFVRTNQGLRCSWQCNWPIRDCVVVDDCNFIHIIFQAPRAMSNNVTVSRINTAISAVIAERDWIWFTVLQTYNKDAGPLIG